MFRSSTFFLLASLAVLVVSFPSDDWRSKSFDRPNQEDEVVVVPLEDNKPRTEDSREDDYGEMAEGYDANSQSIGPFGSFIQGMQAMMWQLRNQMQEILHRIPPESLASNGSVSDIMVVSPWNNLPGNSTSTTKVINGHVVTVNETTYKQGSDGSSAVFHIRVVDIKPQQSETKIEGSNEEVEMVEETVGSNPSSLSSGDAELPSAKLRWFSQAGRPSWPSSMGHMESKRIYAKPETKRLYQPKSEEVPEFMNRIDDRVEVFHEENERESNNGNVVDLSRDILVNKMMSDQLKKGGLVALHPDVELLDISDGKVVGASEDLYQQNKIREPIMKQQFLEFN